MPKRSHQVAALPWRQGENGIEILLVTTRTTKRWVIPKGWTMAGKAEHEAAEIEAYEEAGVRGVADPLSIGRYAYIKLLKNGKTRRLIVKVFALPVTDLLEDWPERGQRERCWVTPQIALQKIGELGLVPIVADFANIARPKLPKTNSFVRLLLHWLRKFFS